MLPIGKFLFRVRGFTPLPFVAAALIWSVYRPIILVVGILLSLAGEMLRIHAIRFAGGATRTREVEKVPRLVTTGPYACVRNPLYLANMCIYAGYALASGALFPYLPLVALLFFIFQYSLIVLLEEDALRNLFGQEYIDYCRHVPRLFPRLNAVPPLLRRRELKGGSPLSEALRQERDTMTGIALTWLLLAVRFIFF